MHPSILMSMRSISAAEAGCSTGSTLLHQLQLHHVDGAIPLLLFLDLDSDETNGVESCSGTAIGTFSSCPAVGAVSIASSRQSVSDTSAKGGLRADALRGCARGTQEQPVAVLCRTAIASFINLVS